MSNNFIFQVLGNGQQLEYTLIQDNARTHTSAFQPRDSSVHIDATGRRRRRRSPQLASSTTASLLQSQASYFSSATAAARIPLSTTNDDSDEASSDDSTPPLILPSRLPPIPHHQATSPTQSSRSGPSSRWDSACSFHPDESRKDTTLKTPSRSYCDESESASEEGEDSSESSYSFPSLPVVFGSNASRTSSAAVHQPPPTPRAIRLGSIPKSQSWPSHFQVRHMQYLQQQQSYPHNLMNLKNQDMTMSASDSGPRSRMSSAGTTASKGTSTTPLATTTEASSAPPQRPLRQRAGSFPDQSSSPSSYAMETLRMAACQDWQKRSSFPSAAAHAHAHAGHPTSTTAAKMIRSGRGRAFLAPQRSVSLQNWFGSSHP